MNYVRKIFFNLLPPLMIAVVILFWAFGPAVLIKNSWTIVVVSALITASVQGLEWVAERHVGWRLDKREFFTDLFYVVLSSTAIAWASTHLADDTLTSIKLKLGITTQ